MENKKKFIVNIAFYAIILALVAAAYKYILPILTPFIIGFCVASIVRLPLRKLHLKNPRHARWAAALLCILVYLIVAALLILVGSWLVSEVEAFITALPGMVENTLIPFFTESSTHVDAMLSPIDPSLADWIVGLGQSAVSSLGQYVTNLSGSAVKWVANSAVGIPGLLIQIILTVVSTFYFAVDYTLVLGFFKRLLPEKSRSVILEALRYAETAVVAFIKSYSIMFVITFVELCIGLSIMRIPYAVAISLAIALFDLMPVLGVGGILLPWSFILLCLGNIPLGLGMLVLYLVIAAVRNSLEPRIVGNKIGLHPLATLVAMILGLKLIGLLGMLFFPIALVAAVNFRKSTQTTPQPTE